MDVEVEAKFRVPDGATLERLARARRFGDYRLGRGKVRHDRDVFLDTPGRAFLRAGYYCRRREAEDGVRFTLKRLLAAQDGVLRREELEAVVAVDVPVRERLQGPLRTRVEEVAAGAPLGPLLELSQQRLARRVTRGDTEVAELSLDEVTVRVGDDAHVWCEAELELRGEGTAADLEVLVAAVRARFRLEPESQSKFVRALALVDAAPPAWMVAARRRKRPAVTAGHTMAEAAQETMRLHFTQMMEHETGTRLGEDAEELHDMRVATRRLRMALRLFEPWLDAGAMRPVQRGLRRTGRRLGSVRDLDVFHAKTLAYRDGLPGPRRHELRPLLQAWQSEHDRRRARLLHFLDGEGYRRFIERLAALLDGPPEALAAPSLPAATVAQVLPGLLHRDLADVLAAGSLCGGRGTPLANYHALRITGKALRYTLEFFERPLGRGCKPLIEATKELQDHLGDLQDAVVSCGILRDVLTWGSWGSAGRAAPDHLQVTLAPGVARYLLAKQEEMERLVDTFPDVWPSVAGEEFGSRLARCLARL